MTKVNDFIKNYTSKDKSKIDVQSNGREDIEWCDLNEEFRNDVAEALLEENARRPGQLLKDIFRAEAQYCRECWGSTPNVTRLGALLLRETKEKYIEDYFFGKEESFDTQCAVSLGDVRKEVLVEIVDRLKTGNIKCVQGEFEVADVIRFIEEYISEHY